MTLSLAPSLFFLAKCQWDNLETKPKRTVEPEVPRNFSQYHNLLGGAPTRPPKCYNGIVHGALIHVWCCVCVCTQARSVAQSCPTLWDLMDCIARQAPLSMRFPKQEYWSGLSCPPQGDLPNPEIELTSPVSPALQADSSPLSHQGSPESCLWCTKLIRQSQKHLSFTIRLLLKYLQTRRIYTSKH